VEESKEPDAKPTAEVPANEPAAETPQTTVSNYGAYISVSDVEEISGIDGIKEVEEPQKIKFTNSNGDIVYEVSFYGDYFYDEEVGGNQEYYTEVVDVGDKAAICLPDSPYRLTFIKGSQSVMTQTLTKNSEGEWILSEEQLVELAKIIASKLP
jgi:hypothetical protein